MVELTVNLPDSAVEYLRQQVAAGSFSSMSDCVLSLLEKARRFHEAQDKLADLVLEGEHSGDGWEYCDEEWPARRDRIIAELQKKSA